MKNTHIIFKKIEDKTVVWFEEKNQYVIIENEAAVILDKRRKGISVENIATEMADELAIPFKEVVNVIKDLENHFLKIDPAHHTLNPIEKIPVNKPENFEYIEYYAINQIVFKINFLSSKERELIHPKFEHLTTEPSKDFDHEFEVYIDKNQVYFYVNQQFIGAWNPEEVHYFQGKFSMELIQQIYQKEEAQWLGVFHASAVSDGKKSILFLGDSGNGKSTSLALLQANGFTCLADDFVPIDATDREVYSFPAAISIKRNSLPTLIPFYPDLKSATEYEFTNLNKIVRYLPPNNSDLTSHLPCKKLVFIKYVKDSDIQVTSISKLEAFSQLIPDSWLSPLPENASTFLDWFVGLKCYQITYSNNEKMIAKVRELFG